MDDIDRTFLSILSSLFIVNIYLFLLLTFLCSHCLHLSVYSNTRLLCSPLSSLKARLISEQFGKGRPHHRATALDLLAITKDKSRFLIEVRLKKLNSTAIWDFCSVLCISQFQA